MSIPEPEESPIEATVISELITIEGLDSRRTYENKAHDSSLQPIKAPLQAILGYCRSVGDVEHMDVSIEQHADSLGISAKQLFRVGNIWVETSLDLDARTGAGFRGTRIIPMQDTPQEDLYEVLNAVEAAYIIGIDPADETKDIFMDTLPLSVDEELYFTELSL